MVKTRIAPSPTGYPHIGTIYQALFNFAYAKKNQGRFIVRIEDTDRKRIVADAEEKIYQALDWFGLVEDESPRKNGVYGPYRQSERLETYKKYAQELIEKGDAYYCFCSKDRLLKLQEEARLNKKPPMYDKHCLKAKSPKSRLGQGFVGQAKVQSNNSYVIRLNVPQNKKIIIYDEIRGKIEFDSNLVDDQVLLKSDGYPTYHLAVVVDDYLMKITHVVRGEEWLSSTPKHFLLYDYFGWQKPKFYHTPVLRNPDKSKLSKRHGHTDVLWYKNQGYDRDAILNFLGLMGWSHPEEKEIFSLSEFISLFDLEDISSVAPIFDLKKLEWLSGEYIRKSKVKSLKLKVLEYIGDKYPEDVVEKTIPLIQERIKKLSDYLPLCEFFFKKPEKYEVDIVSKKDLLNQISKCLTDIKEWKALVIGEAMQNLAKELNIKNSEFFMLLRVAITGKKISPPLNESMEILGREECLKRLKISLI